MPSKDKILMTCAIIGLGMICALVIIASLAIVGYLTGNNFGGQGGRLAGCTASQLSQSMLDQIEKNKAVYQGAAERAGVPWDFLAAIHYRETTLSTTSDNPFQIQNNKNTGFSVESAAEAANKAKALVSSTYGRNLTGSADEETLKLAFLSYNRGAMYKDHGCAWNQSPYVMNQFDDAHKDMKWPDNECEPASTRGKTDDKLGAFTVLSILRGCAIASSAIGECRWSNIKNDPSRTNIVSVTVPVWHLSGGQKVSAKASFQINQKCATVITSIFQTIYNHPDKPPINTVGCYEPRDMANSRHNWGVACDINSNENWCKDCYAKKGSCGTGHNVGSYWKPGNILPDRNQVGWVAGQDEKSIPMESFIANAFKAAGWGRGLYNVKQGSCYNDFMHFSIDDGH